MRTLSLLLALAVSTAHARASVVDVTQSGFGFTPQHVTVQVGDTVHYRRYEGASHFTVVKASWTDLLAWLENGAK